MKRHIYTQTVWLAVILFLITGCGFESLNVSQSESSSRTVNSEYEYELVFPSDQYPETALHIHGAISQGASAICTIDRAGAEANRKQSLAGVATKNGYDRDEWPMAMCEEGGAGASVAYIDSSDNRGAGSWVGNRLRDYPDGTKVRFIVEKPELRFGVQQAKFPAEAEEPESVYYKNCAAVKEAGKAPLYKGDPGYSRHLDRDGNGVACET